jgi:hypothetical protein
MKANRPTTGELSQAALQEHSQHALIQPSEAVPSFRPQSGFPDFEQPRPGRLHAKMPQSCDRGLSLGTDFPRKAARRRCSSRTKATPLYYSTRYPRSSRASDRERLFCISPNVEWPRVFFGARAELTAATNHSSDEDLS